MLVEASVLTKPLRKLVWKDNTLQYSSKSLPSRQFNPLSWLQSLSTLQSNSGHLFKYQTNAVNLLKTHRHIFLNSEPLEVLKMGEHLHCYHLLSKPLLTLTWTTSKSYPSPYFCYSLLPTSHIHDIFPKYAVILSHHDRSSHSPPNLQNTLDFSSHFNEIEINITFLNEATSLSIIWSVQLWVLWK